MKSLIEFPPEVLSHLLFFLPQNSLFNLALTNFHFYEPCLRKLYKKLVIQQDPVLKNTQSSNLRQRLDHLELCHTTICGFSSVEKSQEAHAKLLEARLRTLAMLIEVNPNLASYIEEITITDIDVLDLLEEALTDFVLAVLSAPHSVSKLYVAGTKLRENLVGDLLCSGKGYGNGLSKKFQWKSVCVDDLSELNGLVERLPSVEEIIIADSQGQLDKTAIETLEKVRTILVRDEIAVYEKFTRKLWELYQKHPFTMKNLTTFNVVYTHGSQTLFPYVKFEILENFQVSIGCNSLECDQECISQFFDQFEFSNLKRLAIVQNSSAHLNSHRYCEKWDLTVFQFVKDIVEKSNTLFYLSIRHNVPLDGIIDDGYEGNYLRKVKLYTILLPNLLATIQRHVVNLVLPNLVASLACYEQPMNTFLWNGCKCSHCEAHLEKLDDYLLHHRYFNEEKQVYKDLLTTQLMRSLSEVLADRNPYDANLGDLFQLWGPLRNKTWDFHTNKFSQPFLCLPKKTFEMGEFEDDKTEGKLGFDVEAVRSQCRFWRTEKFFPNYSIVVSHYLNDIIRKMINLSRGDAEDVNIGQAKDENDGYTTLQINKMLINGIDYNFDHEINGTIFFVNSYDGLEDD